MESQPGISQTNPVPEKKLSKSTIIVVVAVVALILIIAAIALGASGIGNSKQVKIMVTYSGNWAGAYGETGSLSTWSGSGDQTVIFTRSSTSSSVVANAMKTDLSSGTLTIKIVSMDGRVLKEASTTGMFGIAQVTWTP